MSKKSELDKYYTKDEVAKHLVEQVSHLSKHWVEPSAGGGAFLKYLPPNTLAFDISPESDGVVKGDWFDVSLDLSGHSVIGNPPFGRNGSVAVKFFNKAAEMGCSYICFVLPKSFKKWSVKDRLNRHYHLVQELDLEKFSFTLNGDEYDVPCCWQVWERKDSLRPIFGKYDSGLFKIVKRGEHDFLVRRVGGRSGEVVDGGSEESTFSIKSVIPKDTLKMVLEKSLPIIKEVRENTSGARSISLTELHRITHKTFKELY